MVVHSRELRHLLRNVCLGFVLTIPAVAVGGIEEHSPLPTAEEWELIMLDDEFWDGVEEAQDQSSESDPATAPYSTDISFMKSSDNGVGENIHVSHPPLNNKWEAFKPDNELSEDLWDHAELKVRFAALGLDLMTEEELKEWEESLDDIPFEKPEEGQVDDASPDGGNDEAGYTNIGGQYAGSDDEEDEEEEDTAEKESGLLKSYDSEEDGYDGNQAVGCQTRGTTTHTTFWGLLALALFTCRRTQLRR